MVNTFTVLGFFVDRVQKCNCYLSASTLTSKNISGVLSVACWSLCMLLLSFPGILTWKCIYHSCLVAVYTLNTGSTLCFFNDKRLKRNIYLWCCVLAWTTSIGPFSSFKTSKYVRQYLTCCFLPSKYVIFAVFFAV